MRDSAVVSIPDSVAGFDHNTSSNRTTQPMLEDIRSFHIPSTRAKRGKISFSILGQDLSHLPDTMKFVICCLAVFFFYLIYGYMQVSSSYCKSFALTSSMACIMLTFYSNSNNCNYFRAVTHSAVLVFF